MYWAGLGVIVDTYRNEEFYNSHKDFTVVYNTGNMYVRARACRGRVVCRCALCLRATSRHAVLEYVCCRAMPCRIMSCHVKSSRNSRWRDVLLWCLFAMPQFCRRAQDPRGNDGDVCGLQRPGPLLRKQG